MNSLNDCIVFSNSNFIETIKSIISDPEVVNGFAQQSSLFGSLPNFGNEHPPKNSAVFLLLKLEENDLKIIYIKRPAYNGVHSSQIAFPGGKCEEQDPSLLGTAYRETFEEIGVPNSQIEYIGELSQVFVTASNFIIYPFVGILKPNFEFTIDKNEVDYVLEVSCSDILKEDSKRMVSVTVQGVAFDVFAYLYKNEMIWGATAKITHQFELVVRKALELLGNTATQKA
ncbi:MAG: CoA pyrophosphatase [Bacteroidales bacterium]|nr:CoA pyrophosphatase [Bacteroidales bacterium]